MVWVDSISVDLDKVEMVLEWQKPKTHKEVRSFFRLASYYRSYMGGFAKLP